MDRQPTAKPERAPVGGNGHAPKPAPRSLAIAADGIRTSQDICDLGAALAEDVLLGAISERVSTGVVRPLTMTLKAAEHQRRHGNGMPVEVADSRRERQAMGSADPLADREAELLEQLAAVRKERAVG